MTGRRRGRAKGGKGGAEPRARIRLREIAVLQGILNGETQHAVAQQQGISQAAVSKIAKRLEERLLADVAWKIERQRARQTIRLEEMYRLGMQAWHASRQDALRRRQRRSESGGAGSTIAEIVSENRHGDPRYLDQARRALADLRALWGVDAPERVAVAMTPYAHLSDAALEAELRRFQDVMAQLPPLATPLEATLTPSKETANEECEDTKENEDTAE